MYWNTSRLSGIDVAVRLLRHQRRLVEARQDELELARIPVDVADGEDAGHAGLERRGVDRDHIRRPSSRCPSRRPGRASWSARRTAGCASQAISKFEPSLRLTIALAMRPPSPSSADTWPSTKSILPSPTSAIILLTLSGAARNSLRRCSSVRWLASGARLSVQSSARVAAADDQHALAAERLHLAHRIEHRGALVGLDPRDRRTLGLERAAAGGDHHDLDLEHLAAVGGDAEQRIADLLDRLDHLLQMECRRRTA